MHNVKKDDLIKTSKGSVGVVIETRKDNIKIVDINCTTQVVSNMDFDSIVNTRNFNAKNNRSGELITSGSSVLIKKGINEVYYYKLYRVRGARLSMFIFNMFSCSMKVLIGQLEFLFSWLITVY